MRGKSLWLPRKGFFAKRPSTALPRRGDRLPVLGEMAAPPDFAAPLATATSIRAHAAGFGLRRQPKRHWSCIRPFVRWLGLPPAWGHRVLWSGIGFRVAPVSSGSRTNEDPRAPTYPAQKLRFRG